MPVTLRFQDLNVPTCFDTPKSISWMPSLTGIFFKSKAHIAALNASVKIGGQISGVLVKKELSNNGPTAYYIATAAGGLPKSALINSTVSVEFGSGRREKATIISKSSEPDIAVLRFESAKEYRVANLSNSNDKDKVFIAGFLGNSAATPGSATYNGLTVTKAAAIARLDDSNMTITQASTKMMTGGGIFNASGALVGVNRGSVNAPFGSTNAVPSAAMNAEADRAIQAYKDSKKPDEYHDDDERQFIPGFFPNDFPIGNLFNSLRATRK
jgi:S1-C subfamily serine protease